MSRYAKKSLTVEDLKKEIESGHLGAWDVVSLSTVESDLNEVEFDTENIEPFGTEDSYNHLPGLKNLGGYEMLGPEGAQFPVLWFAAGGDWELPLVFIVYMGEDNEIHGYVPEDGNAYNHEKKAAYGNNEGDPVYGDKNDTRYVFDVAKMKADIENHIIVK